MPSNYDTTPIDVSSILGSAAAGGQAAQTLNQNFLQHQVGATAATQGLLPASQAAFMGGNVEQGAQLQNLNLEQQARVFDLMGRGAAAADTPEKWNRLVDALEGPDYNGPFRDFGSRNTAQMLGMTAAEQARNRVAQQIANQNAISVTPMQSGAQLAFNKNNMTAKLITPESVGGTGTGGPQGNMLNTPFGANIAQGISKDEVARSQKAYVTAQQDNLQMNQLEDALNKLPTSGPLVPGSTEGYRAGVANKINTLGNAIGTGPMFNPDTVGALEQANKITTGMGFTQAKTLGTREAASIVNQSISIQPGQELTVPGRMRIVAGRRAANQREIDYHEFLTNWIQSPEHSGNATVADEAFNKIHPVSEYVAQAKKEAPLPQDTAGGTTGGSAASAGPVDYREYFK